VFAPLSVTVPAPALVSAPAPEMIPSTIRFWPVAALSVPAPASEMPRAVVKPVVAVSVPAVEAAPSVTPLAASPSAPSLATLRFPSATVTPPVNVFAALPSVRAPVPVFWTPTVPPTAELITPAPVVLTMLPLVSVRPLPPVIVTVPSSKVMPATSAIVSPVAIVTMYEPVAFVPAAKVAVLPATQLLVAVVPVESLVQLAVVALSHVPAASVLALDPAVAPFVSQYSAAAYADEADISAAVTAGVAMTAARKKRLDDVFRRWVDLVTMLSRPRGALARLDV
jgi:hypothetical protein